jgi:hypothetical protein
MTRQFDVESGESRIRADHVLIIITLLLTGIGIATL